MENKKERKIWKVTYMYWCSVVKDVGFVEADTENEALRKFDSNFGYEEIDIKGIEPSSEEELMNHYLYK